MIARFYTIQKKANMVADALSRKSMESLSHVAEPRRDVVRDLQRLFEVGLALETIVTQPRLLSFG